jgi:tetratricopeptide (TPR) repeat protein
MSIVTRFCGLIVASLLTLAIKAAEPGDPDDVKQSFKTAAEKMQAGRFGEAIPLLEKVRAAIPPTPAVEWNLGLAYAALERPEDALACWNSLAQLEPGNFQTTAKIVQALQALGREEERDKAIAQVFIERKQTKNPQLAKIPWFCREQFKVGARKVMAIEYFDPAAAAPRAVYTAFLVHDANDREVFRYSLGSYDETTEVAQSLGQVGPTDRLYHLDYYETSRDGAKVHRTYGFFQKRPSYAVIRKQVVKAMNAETEAVSSSTVPSSSKQQIVEP